MEKYINEDFRRHVAKAIESGVESGECTKHPVHPQDKSGCPLAGRRERGTESEEKILPAEDDTNG